MARREDAIMRDKIEADQHRRMRVADSRKVGGEQVFGKASVIIVS
jgi:hypothetical protein